MTSPATTWRTGRKVGRTIYAQPGPQPADTDPLIGVMDTPQLAAEAVRCHNAAGTERVRIIALARQMGATYPVTLDPPPGSGRQPAHTAFPFADYLEDAGGAP